jgi:hypothetical protein
MLRQEELAFIKVISNIELSPVFLQELRKAVAAGKKKKAFAAIKPGTERVSAPERPKGASGESWTSRDSPQLHVSKRKAEELSSSDCPFASASRCPAPRHMFDDGPEVQGTTGN